jgi:hypothetical protein
MQISSKDIKAPIRTEIENFYEKADIIKNNEKVNHPQSRLNFWFVTNSVSMNDDLLVYSKK